MTNVKNISKAKAINKHTRAAKIVATALLVMYNNNNKKLIYII